MGGPIVLLPSRPLVYNVGDGQSSCGNASKSDSFMPRGRAATHRHLAGSSERQYAVVLSLPCVV